MICLTDELSSGYEAIQRNPYLFGFQKEKLRFVFS